MNVKIDTKEIMDFFKNDLDALDKLGDQAAKKTVTLVANKANALTKQKTPVDTNTLRKSWRSPRATTPSKGVYEKEVYTQTEYVSHVEYGHYVTDSWGNILGFVPGVYMLKKSVNEVEPLIDAVGEEELNKMINKVMR